MIRYKGTWEQLEKYGFKEYWSDYLERYEVDGIEIDRLNRKIEGSLLNFNPKYIKLYRNGLIEIVEG